MTLFVYNTASENMEHYETLQTLIDSWEYEIVEFKEANDLYSGEKIGLLVFYGRSKAGNLRKVRQYGRI